MKEVLPISSEESCLIDLTLVEKTWWRFSNDEDEEDFSEEVGEGGGGRFNHNYWSSMVMLVTFGAIEECFRETNNLKRNKARHRNIPD